MGLRRTLAALVVLAGLVAFLYYYEYKGEAAREEAQEARSRALSFDSTTIDHITIERPGGITIAVARREGAWHLASPIATRADDRIIEDMLSGLRSLKIERTLDGVGSAERGTFGLAEPAARVTLIATTGDAAGAPGGGETALELGGAAPVSGARYAARPGEDGVLLVAGNITTLLEATADSLREKKLFGMDAWTVHRVVMKTQGSSVALEKIGESWRLTGSETVPADGAGVESILASLTPAQASGFADEAPSQERLAALGLTPETGAIDVEVAGDKTTVRAVLGRAAAEGTAWARRSDMDAVMTIAGSVREGVASALASPEALRDPRPARFNRFALSRLTVAEKSGAQQTRALFKDATSSWHLGSEEGTTLPSERVNAILDALETLVADRWAAPQDEDGMQEALSIVLAERDPVAGEEPVEPLTLSVRVPAGSDGPGYPSMKEATIDSSMASLRYIVPGSGVAKLIDAVARLEEPLPSPEVAEEPPSGTGEVP